MENAINRHDATNATGSQRIRGNAGKRQNATGHYQLLRNGSKPRLRFQLLGAFGELQGIDNVL